MSPRVVFIDTSVLCNLLPVPGRDQDRTSVLEQYRAFQDAHTTMVLPITSVIETGNFIAQLADGRERRVVAEKFASILGAVARSDAPWQLHEVDWGTTFLNDLVSGAESGQALVEHATAGIGGGDLCILTERLHYQRRSAIDDVKIWTRDRSLAAYS